MIQVSASFSVAAEEGALPLKLCVLLARATSEMTGDVQAGARTVRAVGYEARKQQRQDSKTFIFIHTSIALGYRDKSLL